MTANRDRAEDIKCEHVGEALWCRTCNGGSEMFEKCDKFFLEVCAKIPKDSETYLLACDGRSDVVEKFLESKKNTKGVSMDSSGGTLG